MRLFRKKSKEKPTACIYPGTVVLAAEKQFYEPHEVFDVLLQDPYATGIRLAVAWFDGRLCATQGLERNNPLETVLLPTEASDQTNYILTRLSIAWSQGFSSTAKNPYPIEMNEGYFD